jgi:hypothetical protein
MTKPENPVHDVLQNLPRETLVELIKMYSRNWHTFEHGFTNVAAIIDPRVRVSCKYCPPGPYPSDSWCQWEFKGPQGPP